jgi:hypothetical protein
MATIPSPFAAEGAAADLQQFFPGLQALHLEIEQANRAVLTLLLSVARIGDPALAALFGIDAAALDDLKTARVSAFSQAIRSGLPLFLPRFSTPDVLSDLRHDMGSAAVLQSILKTFPVGEIPRGA